MSVRRTESSLAKVGVEVLDWSRFWLLCVKCGRAWSPNIPSRGHRFHKGWWRCPEGCNEPEEQE